LKNLDIKFGRGHPPIGYGYPNKKKNEFGYNRFSKLDMDLFMINP
jgi:hypothetical protein